MSEELDRRLILMVESNPHLYDKKLPGYKDKVLCNNSWKSIGDQLNISSEDAMRRWKVLRERFSKVRRQKANIPSGSGASSENQEIEWSLYNTLLFLQPHVQNRKTIGNLALSASQKNKFSDNILVDIDKNPPETQLDLLDESVEFIDEDVRSYLLNIKEETGDNGTSKCTEKLDSNKKRPLLEIENQQKKKKKPQPLPPEEQTMQKMMFFGIFAFHYTDR
ncbi:uncharacterized protein LOC112639828 [Camponotus floridanus]|uniref:uncharacterized protein LOC112639828 n=1 Tax=Camponotus floridanus TaxID=104421 RepID=UPI000DC68BB0|nr:uncharacterized protein LOC112639828 [Camponotus floridanus]